jgi:ribonuclease HI
MRNDIIHHDGKATIAESVNFLRSFTSDCQPAQEPKTASTVNSRLKYNETPKDWSAPPASWLKLNNDGSFISSSGQAGAGAVVRDYRGEVIAASCTRLVRCKDAEETEARAALHGVKLCANLGHAKIILELDSLATASALSSSPTDRSRLWWIHDEIKGLLNKFQDHKILHVRRDANKVADALAKLAREKDSTVSGSALPTEIRELVMLDCNPNLNFDM